MLFGLALGLLVAAGVYVSGARTGDTGSTQDSTQAAATRSKARPASASSSERSANASPAQKSAAPSSAPRKKADSPVDTKKARATEFDFYEILPQYEVVVPEIETLSPPSTGSATPAAPAAPIEKPGKYVLQAGSFRSHGEADRMQASLALLGIESRIQKVTIDDDEFHRVRVGPIDDLETLNRIRDQLRGAGINALVMRMNE